LTSSPLVRHHELYDHYEHYDHYDYAILLINYLYQLQILLMPEYILQSSRHHELYDDEHCDYDHEHYDDAIHPVSLLYFLALLYYITFYLKYNSLN
jgi:hypothetical protein